MTADPQAVPIEGIREAVWQAKDAKRRQHETRSNHASKIGHPCERFLVYRWLNWQDAEMYKAGTQFIFDGGNLIEEVARQQLTEAGFILSQSQRPVTLTRSLKTLNIGARLDFMIAHPANEREQYPLEIKGLGQWAWEKINTVEDMLTSDRHWLKCYPGQLLIYMLMLDVEWGAFYLVNKANYQPKVIWMQLDDTNMEYLETLLQKIERVNKHVAAETYPERVPFSPTLCDWCDYKLICIEEKDYGEGIQKITDPELHDKLVMRDELQPASKLYATLDKEIKKRFRDIPFAQVGDFLISGKQGSRTYKPSAGGTVPTWSTKIERLPALPEAS